MSTRFLCPYNLFVPPWNVRQDRHAMGISVRGWESMSTDQLPLDLPRWEMPCDPSLTRIKVVGVGGGGGSCVGRMLRHNVPGVKYLTVTTHIKTQEPIAHGADVISIGPKVLSRRGPAGDTEMEELALEESATQLRDTLRDTQLVFITAGMGGSTGTRAAPYIANLARELGAFVVGVVTTPFSFEGCRRIGEAITGVARLRVCADSLILIHNDRLLQYVHHDAEMIDAFKTADEVVTQGILSVSELINVPGEINVDFADVREYHAPPWRRTHGHRYGPWQHGSIRGC